MIAIANGRPGIGILRACSVSIVIPVRGRSQPKAKGGEIHAPSRRAGAQGATSACKESGRPARERAGRPSLTSCRRAWRRGRLSRRQPWRRRQALLQRRPPLSALLLQPGGRRSSRWSDRDRARATSRRRAFACAETCSTAPISRPVRSTTNSSGMRVAGVATETVCETMFSTPPRFRPGEASWFLKCTGTSTLMTVFFVDAVKIDVDRLIGHRGETGSPAGSLAASCRAH